MKHKLIISLFFVLIFKFTYNQNTVDSLTIELLKCKKDTTKIPILNKLAMNLYNTKPYLCFEYAELAYKISQKENYKIHYIETLNALAVANWALGNYDKSLEYLFEKLKIHQQKNNNKEIAATLRSIAIIYNETGRYDFALDNLLEALKIKEYINDELEIAEIYNLIGVTYIQIDSIATAKKYWLKAMKLYVKNNQTLQISYIKNNLASVFKRNNQLDSALIFLNESLEVCITTNNNWSISQILKNIAEIYIKKDSILLAEKFYKRALNIAQENKLVKREMNILFSLSQLDTIKKDFKSAYNNYSQYVVLKDSIFSQEQDSSISELQIKYETEKTEQENQLLKKSERIKSLIVTIISIVLILTMILLIFLWRLIHTKQKSNRALITKNNEITKQNNIILKQTEELNRQSEELFTHKNHLENIVKERTKELFSAKEKAVESDRLKTEFFHNMSHEVRTPLNGILGFTSMLLDPDLLIAERKQYMGIIQDSGHQLLQIIDDILEISRLQTKQVKISECSFCLNDVLTDLFYAFETITKEKNVRLELNTTLPNNECIIISDKVKLRKIVHNLLINSIKFTDEGFIKFGYEIVNNEIIISVIDSGIGIRQKNHEIIFKRFSQEEKKLSDKVGGLGLGLSIARENAKLLGGNITLKSEKGKGATFFVTIPYKQGKKHSINNNIRKKKILLSDPPYNHTVLIVEDEEVNYIYLQTLLKNNAELNCTILHANNGKEAVEICKDNHDIDIILMDLKMPTMNGFEATKLIKIFRPNLPIVAQTSYSTIEEQEKAISVGCEDFISKPISEETLVGIINKYLFI